MDGAAAWTELESSDVPDTAARYGHDEVAKYVEALGAELLVHSAIDATTVQEGTSLGGEEAPGSAMLVARLSPRSHIEAGDIVKLTVDTAQLHLFDPTSGLALAGAGPPPPA